MELIIRHATEKDLPGILEIYNDAIINTTAVYDYKEHTQEMRVKWFQEKKQNNFPVLVAVVENKIAGFSSYGWFRTWAAYKYSVEHSVYVHPDFRRRGIAKKILQRLIDEAKQKEVHTMIAGIDANNTISLELHKQLGFEQTAHMKQVGYKFGKWLDLIFMQLILNNSLEPKEI
jgi:L-amino acid N-acyltransferase